MSYYQKLSWDSEVFGFGVARIIPARLAHSALKTILHQLKQENIKLVYWATDSADIATQQVAVAQQGFLADHKVTYLLSLNALPKKNLSQDICEYSALDPSPALEFLALQSGLYSRFTRDPNISQSVFEKIYRLWIQNSVNKQIAQVVLVNHQVEKLAGMVTLGQKNGRGDIGLLAVHPDFRGLSIGTNLVYTAQNWFAERGVVLCQVVTQTENKPACALYEKCGFQREKVENFYHFWL